MEGVEGNGPAAPAGKPHGQHDAKDLVLGLIAVAFVRVTAALPISLVRAITTSLGRIAHGGKR